MTSRGLYFGKTVKVIACLKALMMLYRLLKEARLMLIMLEIDGKADIHLFILASLLPVEFVQQLLQQLPR